MNQVSTGFSLEKVLKVWVIVTISLIGIGVFVFAWNVDARVFITLTNFLNLFLLSCFFMFGNTIVKTIEKLKEETRTLEVRIKWDHDKEIGFVMISLLILFSMMVAFLALFDINSYRSLIKEDGIIEYGSAIFWFGSAIILGYHMLKYPGKRSSGYQVLPESMLMIFFLVCAGEEISWGQRIFGVRTPELFSTWNVQNEITLHNMGSISIFSNVFFLLTVLFFLLIPYLIKKNTEIRNILYAIGFPVPNRFAVYVYAGSLITWIFLGLRFGTLGFHPFSFFPENYYNQMDDEVFEFLAAYSFLCFSILNGKSTVTVIKKE